MATGFDELLDPNGFVPHGVCLLWRPDILALHIASDTLIGLSYFSIPLALLYFVHRRRDLVFGWVALLFAIFIVACGTTHLLAVWTLWNPDYLLEGVVKAITALASLATAATLWWLMPRLLVLPSPKELERTNTALEREIAVRRQAESRYSSFFNNLAEALFIVEVRPDGDFAYEAINPALARATGLNPEQLRGRRVRDALSPEVADAVLGRYSQCRDTGESIDYEEVLSLPVGQRVFHTMLVPMKDANGRVVQLLGSGRDVTERRRLQEEMVQTSKLATLGTLAAGMAHEMSQPLNIIRLWAENILARLRGNALDPDRVDRALTLVIDQTERMARLIDHVRTFGRRDGGSTQVFHPVTCINSAIDLVRHQYALEDIEIVERAASTDLLVDGRPLELEQLILNLFSNARDAILALRGAGRAAGRIMVDVSGEQDGHTMAIQVTDDGGGIDPALLPRIFDPFFTTKEVGQGAGLGLSIGYGIVDRMGGRIDAANVDLEDGHRGLRITIILPSQPASSLDRELSHA
ncbi:sensor histidine kinase [Azospirillum picis]|uniref:histidine kinase n=1 Tax=Azospirillum picis TaxID=488438 RepID=A0ABU0MG72_9PROT|nr:ATP-binding protein [Azospirillum picis]MBP2298519.1 PAS domain S-box-containing protein [Azospirillum picis]MDQ0532432.1 PAS domain S-box-containing protein [Azospirillum picis]